MMATLAILFWILTVIIVCVSPRTWRTIRCQEPEAILFFAVGGIALLATIAAIIAHGVTP